MNSENEIICNCNFCNDPFQFKDAEFIPVFVNGKIEWGQEIECPCCQVKTRIYRQYQGPPPKLSPKIKAPIRLGNYMMGGVILFLVFGIIGVAMAWSVHLKEQRQEGEKNFQDLASGKPIPKVISKEPNPYPAWEYVSFEYNGIEKDTATGKYLNLYMVYDDSQPDDLGGQNNPLLCGDAIEVLKWSGRDGWELAWTDGTHYILKRPKPADSMKASAWRHDGFEVIEK